MTTPNVTLIYNPHNTFGIYQIRNIKTGRLYIGSTTQSFWRRWNQHRLMLRKNRHDNPYLQHSWNFWGEESFRFEVLEAIENGSDIAPREQCILDELRQSEVDLYNIAEAATNPMLGRKHSDETKEKIRRKALGRKVGTAWNKGRVSTPEERQSLSEAIRRGMASPEVKENISKAQTGRKHSEESKLKRSIAFKGDSNPMRRPEVRVKQSEAMQGREPWNKGKKTGQIPWNKKRKESD